MMMTIRTLSYFSIALALVGCNLAQASPTLVPTPTTVSMPQVTRVPTLAGLVFQPVTDRGAQASGTALSDPAAPPTATPAGSCTDPRPDARSARHTVSATLDYAEKRISARHRVSYVNRTGAPLTDLVLNIEPNRWAQVFTLLGVVEQTPQGNISPAYTLTGRRLTIELSETLQPACELQLELIFEMRVPPVRTGVEAFKGYFGYSPRQMNLGHWLPSVAVRMGNEWVTRQSMFVGEQEVVGKADWDVTLTLENAPDTLVIAAPGERLPTDAPNVHHYRHAGARDFSFSLGDGFNVRRAQADTGALVEVYSFPDALIYRPEGVIDAANHALNVALRSLELYDDIFGEYIYDRLLIVQGDFPDGMEFSGLVFVSTDWFRTYDGNPAGYLTLITVHEVAHQWWYARVGNDPALTPWMDEALSTYSEYLFIEAVYPNLRDWWWAFRVEAHAPRGFVDSTVYEFTTIREYINAVYLRGVMMLDGIRRDLGDEAFFDLLRRYADQGAGRVVTPEFFWSIMTPEQLAATERTRRVFLRRPNVVPSP